jgi:hypothetical protein
VPIGASGTPQSQVIVRFLFSMGWNFGGNWAGMFFGSATIHSDSRDYLERLSSVNNSLAIDVSSV